MNVEKTIARFFSIAFHPLLIPTFGMILLFHLNTYISFSIPDPAKRFILVILFVNTAVAPVLFLFLFKRTGFISNVLLDDRQERLLPLFVSSLFFILTYFLFKQVSLPSLINYFIMGATLLVLICLMITFGWKISLHAASMGGLTGFLITSSLLLKADLSWLIMLSVLVSGFVASSRIFLQAHTPAQVYAGFLLGIFVMFTLYAYLFIYGF